MSKNNAYTLKYFSAKCSPRSEPSADYNVFVDGGSCLNADGCWLIRVVVAEGWDGCGNFLKSDIRKSAVSVCSSFHEQFLYHAMLFDSILLMSRTSFSLRSHFSQLLQLHQQSLCDILNFATLFQQFEGIFTKNISWGTVLDHS